MSDILFTILTPTYNRASELVRVYNSLLNQTYKNFEWIIINDGSTDHTEEVVNAYIKEDKFPIRYFEQQNMHKFYSLLKGIELARGKFLIPLDSDDGCKANTLEVFKEMIDKYEIIDSSDLAGVNCLCEDQYGTVVGSEFPKNEMIASNVELFYKHKVRGEKWGCIRLDILKNFNFGDEYFNNGYIPEGIIWNKISQLGYKNVNINKKLRIYYIEDKPSIMEDGKLELSKNAFGALVSAKHDLNNFLKFALYRPRHFLIQFVLVSIVSERNNESPSTHLKLWPCIIYYLGYPFIWFGKKYLVNKRVD